MIFLAFLAFVGAEGSTFSADFASFLSSSITLIMQEAVCAASLLVIFSFYLSSYHQSNRAHSPV